MGRVSFRCIVCGEVYEVSDYLIQVVRTEDYPDLVLSDSEAAEMVQVCELCAGLDEEDD